MGGSTEDLEPLFDYSRVQPSNIVCLDDDSPDSPPPFPSKRKKISDSAVEKEHKNDDVIHIVDCEDKEEEDWMPPPPKVSTHIRNHHEDSTIKELRLKKQELVSFAQSAGDLLRAVEESVKRDLSNSLQSSAGKVAEKPSEPPCERNKIVISIQDKDGQKQFRVYTDDKFERLFKMYAEKVKLDLQNMVFCFDGDKISPTATPDGLGMEDDDIIEVHTKPS